MRRIVRLFAVLLLLNLRLEPRQDESTHWRRVIKAPLEETLGLLVERDKNRLRVVPFERELGHGPGTVLVHICDVRVLTVVNVVADGRRREELEEVAEADEKDSVFFVLAIDLLPRVHGPLGRLVTPIAFPFDSAVWIPDFDQLFRL